MNHVDTMPIPDEQQTDAAAFFSIVAVPRQWLMRSGPKRDRPDVVRSANGRFMGHCAVNCSAAVTEGWFPARLLTAQLRGDQEAWFPEEGIGTPAIVPG